MTLAFPKPTKTGPRRPKPVARRRPIGANRAEVKTAGDVDPLSWDEVVRFYGGHCAYGCGREWRQQDHVIPLSRGGKHEIGNVVPCCEPCNQKKGTQTWDVPTPHPFMVAACSAA